MTFNRWTKANKDRFYVNGLGGAADLARFYIEQVGNQAAVNWDRSVMGTQTGAMYANDIYAEIERRVGSCLWSDLVAAYEAAMENANA